jgi:MFS family permease
LTKLLPLFLLYFAQGLPFGFQATAFPMLLRERGAALSTIGFSGLLAAPWLLKPLWAPLVDRYGSRRFGRRKSWVVPLQLGLAALCLVAAQTQALRPLGALILAMNLLAATQDIAVDALAVSWLDPKQLGPGNALQVVGYKLGMLTGGGLLVWASGKIGWSGLFYTMAGLMLAVSLVGLSLRESESESAALAMPDSRAVHAHVGLSQLFARLRAALREPAMPALLLVVTTYKSGEAMADAMWKPLLLDRGFASADIGLWAGTFGMLASLLGSSAAGALGLRLSLARALLWVASLRALGVAGEWWIASLGAPSAAAVIGVTCVEHLFGGAITTVLFALMMRHTDREIGATHYTLLASLEVWGKLPLAGLSGVIAERFGYTPVFATATLLCVLFSLLAQRLAPRLEIAGQGRPAGAH